MPSQFQEAEFWGPKMMELLKDRERLEAIIKRSSTYTSRERIDEIIEKDKE